MTTLVLKPGREKSVLQRHPWVFSGAIERLEGEAVAGDETRVVDATGRFLARGYLSLRGDIRCRLLRWEDAPIDGDFLAARIRDALALRQQLIPEDTDAYRLIHGEGDGLPGLIVDRYGEVLVMQISHAGFERRKDLLVELLAQELEPLAIYERSEGAARQAEGLGAAKGVVYGDFNSGAVRIRENGWIFYVDIVNGQKTGFYLDQRENRRWVSTLAAGREVLNCYAYTGAFGVAALAGGARRVINVEASGPALDLAQKNVRENGFEVHPEDFVVADVPAFLRSTTLQPDMIILDPPPFARHRKDVPAAARAYKDINLHAMKRLQPGGLLLTCSCSQHLAPEMFQKILFGAARDAGRAVRIIGERSHPVDHPINLYHPEGRYLHAFLLQVGG